MLNGFQGQFDKQRIFLITVIIFYYNIITARTTGSSLQAFYVFIFTASLISFKLKLIRKKKHLNSKNSQKRKLLTFRFNNQSLGSANWLKPNLFKQYFVSNYASKHCQYLLGKLVSNKGFPVDKFKLLMLCVCPLRTKLLLLHSLQLLSFRCSPSKTYCPLQ